MRVKWREREKKQLNKHIFCFYYFHKSYLLWVYLQLNTILFFYSYFSPPKRKRKNYFSSLHKSTLFCISMFYCESGKPLYKKECHFLSLSSSSSKKKRKKGKKDTEATIERVKKYEKKEKEKKKKKKEKQKIKRVIDFCEKEINKTMKIINNKCVYTYL